MNSSKFGILEAGDAVHIDSGDMVQHCVSADIMGFYSTYHRAINPVFNGFRGPWHIFIPRLAKAEEELTTAKAELLACEEKEHKTREEQEQLQAENERQKEELAALKAELDALKKKQSDDAARPFFQKLRSIF